MKNNFFFSGYHYKLPDEQPSTASWGGIQILRTRYGISTVMTPTSGFSIGILSTDVCSGVEKNNTVDGTEIRGAKQF